VGNGKLRRCSTVVERSIHDARHRQQLDGRGNNGGAETGTDQSDRHVHLHGFLRHHRRKAGLLEQAVNRVVETSANRAWEKNEGLSRERPKLDGALLGKRVIGGKRNYERLIEREVSFNALRLDRTAHDSDIEAMFLQGPKLVPAFLLGKHQLDERIALAKHRDDPGQVGVGH